MSAFLSIFLRIYFLTFKAKLKLPFFYLYYTSEVKSINKYNSKRTFFPAVLPTLLRNQNYFDLNTLCHMVIGTPFKIRFKKFK